MSPYVRLAASAGLVFLGGCAANSYCRGVQDYQKAESVPPLTAPEGMTLPESPSALRIPPPPPNAVAYGEVYRDDDGDERVRCLDVPPPMPAPASPAGEKKPT